MIEKWQVRQVVGYKLHGRGKFVYIVCQKNSAFLFLLELRHNSINFSKILPRDLMRKRGLCYLPVSVRPSVTLVYCYTTRLKIS